MGGLPQQPDPQAGASTASGSAEAGRSREPAERLRELEERLRASEERFLQFAEHIDQVFWLVDWSANRMLYVSPAYARLYDRSPEELYTDRDAWKRAVHPDDVERIERTYLQEVTKGGWEEEYRIVRRDGSIRWIRDRAFPIRDARGGVYRVAGIAEDITARRAAESELRASEEKNRRLLENDPDHVLIYDRQGRIAYINHTAEGFTPAQVLGKRAADFIHDEDRGAFCQALEEVYTKGQKADLDMRDVNGRCYAVRLVPLQNRGQIEAAMGVVSDITARKQADRALRESEAKFRRLAENIPGVVYLCRNDARYSMLYLNEAVEQITGYPAREFLADRVSFVELYHPADAPGIATEVDAALAERRPFNLRYRIRRRDGKTRWIHEIGVGVFEGQELKYLEGYLHDVSERAAAEEALRHGEAQYRGIFEAVADGILILSLDGRPVEANPAACALTGRTREDLLARRLTEWLYEHAGERYAEFLDALRARQAFHDERNVRVKDGARRDLDLRACVFPYAGADHILVLLRDLSEQKRLERQLQQAQKLETVGRFAGGIAHDFNNLLGAVMGYAQMGLLREDDPREVARCLKFVIEAAEHGASLTGQLLAFARKQVLQPRSVCLNELIQRSVAILNRLIGEEIELEVLADAGLRPVFVDAGQIEQVVFNLAVNARDAMPHGGKLTVRAQPIHVGEAEAKALGELAPGDYALLEIADTGVGIPADVLPHIFEPFFTTKEHGKGTGLGLATCYGIVKQHKGHLAVESREGAGAAFRVFLPYAQAEPDPVARSADAALFPKGHETVLLAEDEASLRVLVAELLAQLGYTVLQASNGSKALEAARAHGGPIDLLITDVVMPEMGGRELAERLRGQFPNLKILYTSGYSNQAMAEVKVFGKAASYLAKPFMPSVLADEIRRLLDGKA
ncbi:MAG: PAS domain S-box protein [Planctomycetota bacterium]|nr:PAS domain S-box protein [Planctomycetota bacterium]